MKEFAGKTKNGQSLWKCLCTKCNKNYTITSRSNLMKKINPVTMCRKCAERIMSERQTVDLTDNIIGNIKVLYRNRAKEDTKDYRVTIWRCKCLICGEEFDSVASKLVGEDHITCCPNCREDWRTTHNMTHTEFYSVWGNMKDRCYNKDNSRYNNYGGRGIAVCDRWLDPVNGFKNFKEDMYDTYLEHIRVYGESDTTIERIDVNKNYCKENCTWATLKEQANNKTTNHYVFYNNETLTLMQCVEKYADCRLSYDVVKRRIYSGWDLDSALHELPNVDGVQSPIIFISKDKDNTN